MNALVEVMSPGDIEARLAQHAEVIRVLSKRVIGDVIEIGRRLTEAKADIPHGGWLPWLEREFGWSEWTARRFIDVHELVEGKSGNLHDLNLPVSGLYLLARPSTPAAVTDAVLERAAAGETFTHAQVQKEIAKAKAEVDRYHEDRIGEIRKQAKEQAEKLKQELDKALSHAAIENAVNEALKPFQKKIELYEAQLKDAKEKAEKAKTKKKKSPADHPQYSLANQLDYVFELLLKLAEKMTPDQYVAGMRFLADMTDRPLAEVIRKDVANAEALAGWLEGFLKTAKVAR